MYIFHIILKGMRIGIDCLLDPNNILRSSGEQAIWYRSDISIHGCLNRRAQSAEKHSVATEKHSINNIDGHKATGLEGPAWVEAWYGRQAQAGVMHSDIGSRECSSRRRADRRRWRVPGNKLPVKTINWIHDMTLSPDRQWSQIQFNIYEPPPRVGRHDVYTNINYLGKTN